MQWIWGQPRLYKILPQGKECKQRSRFLIFCVTWPRCFRHLTSFWMTAFEWKIIRCPFLSSREKIKVPSSWLHTTLPINHLLMHIKMPRKITSPLPGFLNCQNYTATAASPGFLQLMFWLKADQALRSQVNLNHGCPKRNLKNGYQEMGNQFISYL